MCEFQQNETPRMLPIMLRVVCYFSFEMFVVRSDGCSKEKMKGFVGKKRYIIEGHRTSDL